LFLGGFGDSFQRVGLSGSRLPFNGDHLVFVVENVLGYSLLVRTQRLLGSERLVSKHCLTGPFPLSHQNNISHFNFDRLGSRESVTWRVPFLNPDQIRFRLRGLPNLVNSASAHAIPQSNGIQVSPMKGGAALGQMVYRMPHGKNGFLFLDPRFHLGSRGGMFQPIGGLELHYVQVNAQFVRSGSPGVLQLLPADIPVLGFARPDSGVLRCPGPFLSMGIQVLFNILPPLAELVA
jgi:hypothetical protein